MGEFRMSSVGARTARGWKRGGVGPVEEKSIFLLLTERLDKQP